ncbi:DUF1049 domain-containing protein [Saccharibacter sp. 17.LH.SD]|uniref:lipopolysaccharide assembly protein LapA domain-containing protein n=1 Tax=Saccharibacter sp. 17.LH.SD TaxID=2689393 RepID=UPI001367D08D|nr:LapA family protein [Saccharibacter sp. 17.LH.SD]MXV43539.1 DUF1049 domain-containing protein [Saccharibacter sp. 17.LH.SD]
MLRLLIIVLVVLFLATVALSNTDPMTIWLGPWQWEIKPDGIFIFAVPLAGLVIGFLLGWMGELRQRRRARRAENQVRSLEKQIVELHQRLDQAQASAAPSKPAAPAQTETVQPMAEK